MKIRFLKALALSFACLMLFAACNKVPTMKMKDGVYVNQKTKVSYVNAPSYYRANEYVEKAVAKIEPKEQAEFLLYAITGLDEKQWLCDADFSVYCAVGVTPPELWEMSIHAVYINRTINASYTVQKIVDTKDIEALINTYQNGTSFSYNDISHADVNTKPNPTRYDIVFEDVSLSYCLIYLQFEEEVLVYELISDPNNFSVTYPGVEVTTEKYKDEYYAVYHFGTHIMYDRETGRCYPIGEVLSQYFED